MVINKWSIFHTSAVKESDSVYESDMGYGFFIRAKH